MEPAEIVGLVEHREALVHGVKEGVIALDRDGRVTVANDSARDRALPDHVVGRRLEELHLDPQLVEVLSSRQIGSDRLVLVGDRVLALNRRPMRSHGTVIGSVTTLRDRTVGAGAGARHDARDQQHSARADPRVRQPAAHDLGPAAP